ncbi:MAG: putative DNA binding domain-containing protein [Candidatus Riflebacteria bacterium]|nr:putative DNA binding domain-containing protein [Candidatus Riflebacteria bacterium]
MRENQKLEFKSDLTNTFLKTVSAFANYGGGEIIFGISDDGVTVGVNNLDQTCLDIENKINDSISPKPNFTFNINRKKNTITLSVKEGSLKPYLYKAKAYKRNGTSTIEVDRIELNRLILEGENLTFDEIEAKNQELSFYKLQQDLIDKIGIDSLSKDILKTLGFFTKNGKYNNGAELLADKNSFYGIDIARFGETIDYILDRETIYNVSVLEQYDKAVELYKKYYQYEVVKSIERKTVETIPEKAFREAIANAIVHRTWDVNAHIKVSMFSDRIEITSIGGLPPEVTPKDYLSGHVSILRNPILGDVFFRLSYIERFGTGVKRINEAYQSSSKKPIFELFDNLIKVTLPVMTSSSMTRDEIAIYSLMSNGKQITSAEAAQALACGKSKATALLNKLAKEGYVVISGSGRSTKYRRRN